MEIPRSIQNGIDFYDYCVIMSGGSRKPDCITIRLAHTRMKLEASYTVCSEDIEELKAVLEAIHGGKARILEVTHGKSGKSLKRVSF